MKLQVKLTFYNAIFQAVIVLSIGILLPIVIQQVVYNHIDKRLHARAEKMIKIIELGGLDGIITDQECSYGDYNIFKEEYVAISPLSVMPTNFGKDTIGNAEVNIDPESGEHHTSHTLSPVPAVLTVLDRGLHSGTLADIAPTILTLLGLTPPTSMTGNNLT